MMIGSPRLDDSRNAAYMGRLGVAVVSVDYRLVPGHPFPAGVEDALAVAGWLVDHAGSELGTERLLIGGESAGGYWPRTDGLGLTDRSREILEAVLAGRSVLDPADPSPGDDTA